MQKNCILILMIMIFSTFSVSAADISAPRSYNPKKTEQLKKFLNQVDVEPWFNSWETKRPHIRCLVAEGADPNQLNLLPLAVEKCGVADECEDADCVKFLIDQGADCAAALCQVRAVRHVELLLTHKADIQRTDALINGGLICRAMENQVDAAVIYKYCHPDSEIDPNKININGQAALHKLFTLKASDEIRLQDWTARGSYASSYKVRYYKDEEMLAISSVLLHAGACLKKKDKDGKEPIHYLTRRPDLRGQVQQLGEIALLARANQEQLLRTILSLYVTSPIAQIIIGYSDLPVISYEQTQEAVKKIQVKQSLHPLQPVRQGTEPCCSLQ